MQYMTFDADLRLNVTGNIVQYPLHYVTYALVTFEANKQMVKKMHLLENTLFDL